jgi:hypothetical protein
MGNGRVILGNGDGIGAEDWNWIENYDWMCFGQSKMRGKEKVLKYCWLGINQSG